MHIPASSLAPQAPLASSDDAQWLVETADARWLAEMATVAQAAGRNDDAVFFINMTYAANDRDAAKGTQSSPTPDRPAKKVRRKTSCQATRREMEVSSRIWLSTSQAKRPTLLHSPRSQSSSSLSA